MCKPPLLSIVALLLAVSCEPEDRPAFRAQVCLQLAHHGVVPADATVYQVRSPDFPGYGADMLARFDVGKQMQPTGRVCFEELAVGSHWFAAEGWDTFLADSVRGSKFVEITTRQDRYEVEMAVSEQH